jgi:hypothetical protein
MKTEEYEDSDDGYITNEKQQVGATSTLLVEGRK